MAYIQVELDAIDRAQCVACATGLRTGEVIGNLVLLWRWCWREKREACSSIHLRAFFGSAEFDTVVEALETFGFVERSGDEYRIKGAGRYLRIAEASAEGRRKGGLAAKNNLKQYRAPAGPASPAKGPEVSRSRPGDRAGVEPDTQPVQKPAPSSEQRTARDLHSSSTKKNVSPPPFELTGNAPQKPQARSEAQKFRDWCESERERVLKLVPGTDPDPAVLNTRFKAAIDAIGFDRLKRAYAHYLLRPVDDYWKKRGFPFMGFMSDNVWRQYAPPEGAQ